MSPVALLLSLASIALGAARVCGAKSILFQGIAHIFVGGLFGAWLGNRPARGDCLVLALVLTALEIACFLCTRALT